MVMFPAAAPYSALALSWRWALRILHGRMQPKIAGGGGGAVRGSEGHPADDDDLASEKGHLFAKRALFSTITGGGGGERPMLGTALYYTSIL